MAKHLETNRQFNEEKLEFQYFFLVRIEDQLADILTKVVEFKAFKDVLKKFDVGVPTIKKLGICY